MRTPRAHVQPLMTQQDFSPDFMEAEFALKGREFA
jgi:hypothetical protein